MRSHIELRKRRWLRPFLSKRRAAAVVTQQPLRPETGRLKLSA
jgi:hypothetical protein